MDLIQVSQRAAKAPQEAGRRRRPGCQGLRRVRWVSEGAALKGQATEALAQAGVPEVACASASTDGCAARAGGVWGLAPPLGGAFFRVSDMGLPRGVIALIDVSG